VSPTPEQEARIEIDRMLLEFGWLVQDVKSVNLHAGGVWPSASYRWSAVSVLPNTCCTSTGGPPG